MPDHLIKSEGRNLILILGNIKTIMFKFQSTKYPPHLIQEWKRRLYMYSQDRYKSVPDYHKSLCNNIDRVEHNMGAFRIERVVVSLALSGRTPPPQIDGVSDTS